MAKGILSNVRLFAGGCDLTSQSNKVDLGGDWEEKDSTTWGSYDPTSGKIAKEVMGGLFSAKISASGFWDANDLSLVDDAMWASRGARRAWTVCPTGAAEGSLAWLQHAVHSSYQILGSPGDIAPWQASMTGSGTMARGQVASAPGTPRTATGSGTILDLGAAGVPSGHNLLASLHVLSVAGTSSPTITAAVQSAATAGFGSPTTRLTFTAATAIDGQWQTITGPITDRYYRLAWTISGTSPSFLVAAAIGVD
jgi:hypothetical protein